MYIDCYIYCPKVTQGTASSLILLMTIKFVAHLTFSDSSNYPHTMRIYHPPPQLTPRDNVFTQPSNMGPDHPNDNQLPGFSATFGGFESHMTHLGSGQNQFTYPPPLPPLLKPTPAGWMQQINPSLIDYKHEDDKDKFPPLSTFLSDVAKPAQRVAGSRHMNTTIPTAKAKGKARVMDSAPLVNRKRKAPSAPPTASDSSKKRGRQQGAPNYNEDDIDALLDACESCLPVSAKTCSSKSFELKFKQFIRTTKPTEDAECPPYIDSLINEKAGTCDLNDKELADEVVEISDDNKDTMASVVLPKMKPTQIKLEVHEPCLGPTARCATSPTISHPPRSSRSAGVDLLTTISVSLDPCLQAVQDEERSARAIQSMQVLSLTTQLRDAHATINKLHGQLVQVEQDCSNSKHHADHLEMQLEMAKFMTRTGHQQQEHVHHETIYRDKGHSTIWVTPDDAGDDFNYDDHDIALRHDVVEDSRAGHYTGAIIP
ncbi:uncharacterized protein HD556DRAFT_1447115 [Suillus plorans]|uniref:Uncharacterized protein n=1 Tax=Suillus plorans TaxID=116603 RepID=A0A9P7AIK7_9AGAM|nr:uncharacterized protein HD556DRAFT_1447115 [Suillus plorans]KAG1789266.1 hypothetical protein HD556DRAFT_1447115 [Suillus plorans]